MPERSLIAYSDKPILGRDGLSSRYLQTMGFFNGYSRSTARSQGRSIAEQLAALPEGRRGVHPFYMLGYQLKAEEYPVDAVTIFERGEVDVREDVAAFGHLGAELSRRGIELDYVYCDVEVGLSPWTLGIQPIIEVYRSDAARARMPEELRGYDVSKLKSLTPEYAEWVTKFGVYADKIRDEAIRKIVIESGLMSPWGERTTAVNFNSLRTSFPIYDYNGWIYERRMVIHGRTSCPVCMPGPHGQRYDRREHHRYWNSLIDLINHARSAGACGEVSPVIREAPRPVEGHIAGTVDPGGRWFLDHLMGHLIRAGAHRFMYFHPAATAADDRALAEIMDKHAGALPKANPVLPEIRLDEDEIVTGDWRTSYAEFLEQKPERWPSKT